MNKRTQDLILANVKAVEQGEPLEYFPTWGKIMSKDTQPHVFMVRVSIGNGFNDGMPVGKYTFESILECDKWMSRIKNTNHSPCLSFDIELYFDGQPEPSTITDYEPNPDNRLVQLAQDKLSLWEYIKRSPNVHRIYGGIHYINERINFWSGMIANESELE